MCTHDRGILRSFLFTALLAALLAASPAPGAAGTTGTACVPVPVLDDRCEAWTALYSRGAGWGDQARGLAIGGNRAFVTGLTLAPSGYPGYDYATVAYDLATGAQLWARTYDGPLADADIAWGAAAAPDGSRVYVTGDSPGPPGKGSDFTTLAYEGATGAQLWEGRHHIATVDSAKSVLTSPDGETVYVLGITLVEGANYGFVLLAYDAETGEELWTARHVMGGYTFSGGFGIDPSGRRLFVAGSVPGGSGTRGRDFVVRAFRAVVEDPETETPGEPLWTGSYDGAQAGSQDTAASLAVSADGSKVFVTGSAERAGGFLIVGFDMATAAFDAGTGKQLWAKRYPGASGGTGAGSDVAVGPDGSRVYVAGHASGSAGDEYATIAYDAATGNEAWVARYDFPAYPFDRGVTAAVAPNGQRVYVAGASSAVGITTESIDLATIAYDASGGRQWVARYNSSPALVLDADRPWTMAVAPLGRVVVTGGFKRYTEQAPLGEYDYGVLAYDA